MSLGEALRRDPALAGRLGGPGEGGPFVALNAAFLEDGAFVHLKRGHRLPDPLHLLFLGTGKASHPRNLYVVEDGAACDVVETYASLAGARQLTNAVSEIALAPGAALAHYRLQLEAEGSYHFGSVRARLERRARLVSHAVTCGGALTRSEITAALDGEEAHCTLNGLYVIRGTQHVDNYTRIEHRKPHCESHELYKGVLDQRASGVFTGRIHVFPDAQKTDAYQASANLLLSEEAMVDAQPQLEIYADDVKCSHGSTIGQLDRDALFYLRSRGLPETKARHLLVRGFAGEVSDRLEVRAVRERVEGILAERLGGE
jgi:Fe-S cluster assembly protein SufD